MEYSVGAAEHGATTPLGEPLTALAIWVAALIGIGALLADLPSRSNQLDFSHYYVSALALRKGLNPYQIDLRPHAEALGLNVSENVRATYPPAFLLCFAPLTRMRPEAAYWTWIAINVAALGAALFLLLGKSSGLPAILALSLAGIALLYPALEDDFHYAQPQPIMLLALVLVMRWSMRGWERAAGAMLGLAVLLRVFPAIMICYWLARRRWRALAYTVAAMVAGLALVVAYAGLKTTADFATAFAFVTNAGWLIRPANLALNSFIARLFAYSAGYPMARTLDVIRLAVEAVAELALLWWTVKTTVAKREGPDLGGRAFSLWIVATILLSPTAWIHYMVLLLIPFAQIACAAYMRETSARVAWMAVASLMGLIIFAFIYTTLEAMMAEPLRKTIAEAPFVALALAYVATYWFVSDSPARRAYAQDAVVAAGS